MGCVINDKYNFEYCPLSFNKCMWQDKSGKCKYNKDSSLDDFCKNTGRKRLSDTEIEVLKNKLVEKVNELSKHK